MRVLSGERQWRKQDRTGKGAKPECGLIWSQASAWSYGEPWDMDYIIELIPPWGKRVFCIHISFSSEPALTAVRRIWSRKLGRGISLPYTMDIYWALDCKDECCPGKSQLSDLPWVSWDLTLRYFKHQHFFVCQRSSYTFSLHGTKQFPDYRCQDLT